MILVGDDGVIAGETTDRAMSAANVVVNGKQYTGVAIEITDFSLSGQASGASRSDPSEKKSSPRLNDKLTLNVTKNLDSSSPLLMNAYGQHLQTTLTGKDLKPFKQLEIRVRKAGDVGPGGGAKQAQYLSLVFELVYLAKYTCGGANQSNMDMPTEALEFRFKKVSMSYWPQQTSGGISPSTMKTMSWNFFGPSSA
jgi:type VI protein secretion system component Hcp